MKKILVLLLLSASIATSAFASSDALEYSNSVVAIIDRCSKAESSFFAVCKTYNKEDIQAALKTFESELNDASSELNELSNDADYTAFKAAARKLVDAYQMLMVSDYKTYAHLYGLSSDEFSKDDEKLSNTVSKRINKTMDKAFAVFGKAQEKFAKENDFTVGN